MRVIETGSLTLEPQTAAHAEEMFVVLSDPATYEYENEPPPSLEWLRRALSSTHLLLRAQTRESSLDALARAPGFLAGIA